MVDAHWGGGVPFSFHCRVGNHGVEQWFDSMILFQLCVFSPPDGNF